MFRAVLLSCFALTLACAARRRAEPTTPAPAPAYATQQTVAVSGGGITREDFIVQMRPILLPIMCEPTSYFRQCFAVGEVDCYTLAGVAYDSCTGELVYQMPPVLYTEADGAAAGEMIGTCAGTAYEQGLAMNGLRYNTPACNDPSIW